VSARRLLIWRGLEEWLAECGTVALGADELHARGVQLGVDPEPYRLDYELETGPAFVTRRLRLTATGAGWTRELDLRRDPGGAWSEPGLDGALDCDLALSPLTNFMPVRRNAGEPGEHSMAWVSVPDLAVHRSEQRYEPLPGGGVRFSDDTGFTADLELDDDGFVTRYPGLAERA
jgi:hypothetical protein